MLIHPPRLALALFVALFSLLAHHAHAQQTRTVPPDALARVLAGPLPAFTVGSNAGDVTIVEYFDYNCPVCRALEPQLRSLLAEDTHVRLVRKDWPIFGAGSEYAAYCSFAARNEAEYRAIHDTLIGTPRNLRSKADVLAVLGAAGLDTARIESQVASHQREYSDRLARNLRESQELGFRGTPGVIVGDQLVVGGANHDTLQALIAQTRQAKAQRSLSGTH